MKQCQNCENWKGNKGGHPLEHQVIARCSLVKYYDPRKFFRYCDSVCDEWEKQK